MKIAIVGPGAMGLLFSGLLTKSGHNVIILDHKKDRADRLNKTKIEVSGLDEFSFDVNFTSDARELASYELVIVFVKAYSTKSVADTLKGAGLKNYVLTLQNGLGNAETLVSALGNDRVLAGTTSFGATKLAENKIRLAGRGGVVIGALSAKNKNVAEKFANIFIECGLETKLTDDPRGAIFSKAIINVGINALTAIARLQNGKIAEFPELWEVSAAAVREASEVAKAEGIKLLFDDPVEATKKVCIATALNRSSMLQDVEANRKTEIDFINGKIVSRAQRHKIPAPVNWTLWRLVKAIERKNALEP